MTYFAKLDNTNKVIGVYPINDGDAPTEQDGINFLTNLYSYEYWKETNKNGSIRKNYAGINHQYDSTRDVFIGVQPYSSWTLNETTCQWEAPVVEPDDGKRYTWNEDTTNWTEIE